MKLWCPIHFALSASPTAMAGGFAGAVVVLVLWAGIGGDSKGSAMMTDCYEVYDPATGITTRVSPGITTMVSPNPLPDTPATVRVLEIWANEKLAEEQNRLWQLVVQASSG